MLSVFNVSNWSFAVPCEHHTSLWGLPFCIFSSHLTTNRRISRCRVKVLVRVALCAICSQQPATLHIPVERRLNGSWQAGCINIHSSCRERDHESWLDLDTQELLVEGESSMAISAHWVMIGQLHLSHPQHLGESLSSPLRPVINRYNPGSTSERHTKLNLQCKSSIKSTAACRRV